MLLVFHLDVITVLDHGYEIHQVHKLSKFTVDFVEVFLLLHVVSWDFIVKFSCDPRMLKSLLNRITKRWLRVAELLDEILAQRRELFSISQLLKVKCFLFICLLIFSTFPERVLPCNKFVHHEPCCPNVNSFSIVLPSCHLLWGLVNQSTTVIIYTLFGLILDCKTEIYKL